MHPSKRKMKLPHVGTGFRNMLVFLVLSISGTVFAIPPRSVLSELDTAVALLQKADIPTSYVSSTVFDMMDGAGKKLQTTEIRERVTLEPGKDPVRETLYRKTTGEDAGAGQAQQPRNGQEGRNGGNQMSMQMVFPTGRDAENFVFGATGVREGLASADFSPAPSAGSKEGMTKGTLFWDPATGSPVRLDAVPIQNPPFTSRLEMSFEFTRADDFSYPSRIEFSGEGGFLFFQRKIESVTIISDVTRMGTRR